MSFATTGSAAALSSSLTAIQEIRKSNSSKYPSAGPSRSSSSKYPTAPAPAEDPENSNPNAEVAAPVIKAPLRGILKRRVPSSSTKYGDPAPAKKSSSSSSVLNDNPEAGSAAAGAVVRKSSSSSSRPVAAVAAAAPSGARMLRKSVTILVKSNGSKTAPLQQQQPAKSKLAAIAAAVSARATLPASIPSAASAIASEIDAEAEPEAPMEELEVPSYTQPHPTSHPSRIPRAPSPTFEDQAAEASRKLTELADEINAIDLELFSDAALTAPRAGRQTPARPGASRKSRTGTTPATGRKSLAAAAPALADIDFDAARDGSIDVDGEGEGETFRAAAEIMHALDGLVNGSVAASNRRLSRRLTGLAPQAVSPLTAGPGARRRTRGPGAGPAIGDGDANTLFSSLVSHHADNTAAVVEEEEEEEMKKAPIRAVTPVKQRRVSTGAPSPVTQAPARSPAKADQVVAEISVVAASPVRVPQSPARSATPASPAKSTACAAAGPSPSPKKATPSKSPQQQSPAQKLASLANKFVATGSMGSPKLASFFRDVPKSLSKFHSVSARAQKLRERLSMATQELESVGAAQARSQAQLSAAMSQTINLHLDSDASIASGADTMVPPGPAPAVARPMSAMKAPKSPAKSPLRVARTPAREDSAAAAAAMALAAPDSPVRPVALFEDEEGPGPSDVAMPSPIRTPVMVARQQQQQQQRAELLRQAADAEAELSAEEQARKAGLLGPAPAPSRGVAGKMAVLFVVIAFVVAAVMIAVGAYAPDATVAGAVDVARRSVDVLAARSAQAVDEAKALAAWGLAELNKALD